MAVSQVENAIARVPVTNGADTYPSWRLSDVAGDVVATGVVEVKWPIAAIAMAYIAGQTVVDTLGD